MDRQRLGDAAGVQVETKIGDGRDTDLFRVRRDGETYALKVRKPDDDPSTRDGFRREATILARLRHPVLPRVWSVGTVEERPFMIMDDLEGRSLAEILESGPIGEHDAARIGIALARGLSALHRADLVHCDLHPSNILWDGETAQLINFEHVRDRGRPLGGRPDGRVGYAAPEQRGLLNRPLDGRTDLYALGAVLYRAVVGHSPPAGEDGEAAPRPRTDAGSLDELGCHVSSRFAEVVEPLLAAEPDQRIPDAEHLSERLVECLGEAHEPEVETGTFSPGTVSGSHADAMLAARVDEADRLLRQYELVRRAQRGALAVMRGKTGMGKSTVLEGLVRRLDGQPGLTLRTACSPEDHTPYAVVRHLIRRIVELESAAVGRDLPDPAELVEDDGDAATIRALVQGASSSSSGDAESAGTFARYLGRLADRAGSAVFVVDDAQWIDEPSAETLRELGLMLDRFPVQLVVALEPFDAGDVGGRLWRVTRHIDALASTVELLDLAECQRRLQLELPPLSEPQIARYLESFLGESVGAPELVSYLHSASGGRPILLEEYLRMMLEAFILRPSWDGWIVDDQRLTEVDLSEDARSLQAERVDRVDGETRRLCALAAAWGLEFPADLIARAADMPPETVVERLDRAGEAGVVLDATSEAAAGPRYQFTHVAVREALTERFADLAIAGFHQRLAEAADDDPNMSDYVVASHLVRGDGSSPERTLRVCRAAGKRAVEEGAFGDGVAFLEAAREAAADLGREFPPMLGARLGRAYLQRNRIEEGRAALEQAMVRSEDPVQRASCQIEINKLAVARLEVGAVRRGVQRFFDLLDVEFAEAGLEAAIGTAKSVVTYLARRTGSERSVAGRRRERFRLLTFGFDQLSMVGLFEERPGLALRAQIGRMNAALQLGPSYELVLAHTSAAMVWVLMGRREASRQSLAEARRVAEADGGSHARARVDVAECWIAHPNGEPQAAVEGLGDILIERGDQLSLTERRLSYEVVIWSLGVRGHSNEVLEWFEYWCSVHDVDPEEGDFPPAPIYGVVLIHARFCGRDELADKLREASRRTEEVADGIYLEKLHWGAVAGDVALAAGDPDEIDAAIERRRRLGIDPAREVFWARIFFVHQAYARWHQCKFASEVHREHYVGLYRQAVEELAEAAGDHPTLQGHAHLHQAKLALREGDDDRVGRHLARAERLSREVENRWASCYVARIRSRWLDEQSRPPAERDHAQHAVRVAERNGWVPHAAYLRRLFELEGADRERSRETWADGGGTSSREAELERQLEALLEISAATESVLDPTKVQRTALDAAVDVLGAEQGFLFLWDDEEFALRRGRSADGEDLSIESGYYEPIVDRVIESGEPAVMSAAISSEYEIRSAIAVPLQIDDDFVGILYLDSRVARGLFGDEDIDVLRAIANQIGVAIATARTAQLEVEVAGERKRRTYAEQLRAFGEDVNAMLDTTAILERLVEQLRETLAFDSAAAALVVDGNVRLDVLAEHGDCDRRPFDAADPPDVTDSPVVEALLESAGVEMVERLADGDERPAVLGERTSSWLGLPVRAQDEIYGIVVVGSERSHHFEAVDIEGALAYASQAGVAIAKARLATIDPLTGVYNRRKLFELAEREFARVDRYPASLSVLMLDIDNFKEVNDSHGHAVGDRLLARVAEICRTSLRETDIVGRYGGEEFGVVLPSTERRDAAAVVARRLCDAVRDASVTVEGGDEIGVTVSIGVAERRGADRDVHDLFERADEALYAAKTAGKDQVATGEACRRPGDDGHRTPDAGE